jgi:hypothetical protein
LFHGDIDSKFEQNTIVKEKRTKMILLMTLVPQQKPSWDGCFTGINVGVGIRSISREQLSGIDLPTRDIILHGNTIETAK